MSTAADRPRRVAVLAGSGKTGVAVSRALGERAVPLGRSAWPDLEAALAGSDALVVVAPNLHPDEPDYVDRALAAARAAGIRRVVYHSVAAPYAPAMPHHVGKAQAEDVVRRSGLAWTILQPCAYVQNFLPALAGEAPTLRVPYDVERTFGLVDLADVAAVVRGVLVEEEHVGATYELGGPALVSVRDVAAAATEVLGASVPAERLDPGEWAVTTGAALPEREREWLLAMFAYYDAFGLPAGSLTLRSLLGGEPASPGEVLRRELLGG